MDDEQRYQALAGKDARFDGVFITAVTTTGVYCRPSCPAITPKRQNIRFFKTAATAQEAGFRACKRCRPDASPGSPEWNVRADVTARAMRLIADGVVDRDGIAGLAARLGYEQRQVRRLLTSELGAGPLALARAQRAQTARILIETTALPMGDIAFAAGFTSIRQFNATVLEIFDTSPTRLREQAARRHPGDGHAPPGVIRLRLAYRPPIDLGRLLGFLAARAIPGVEDFDGHTYKRAITLPNGPGVLSLRPAAPPGQAQEGRGARRQAHPGELMPRKPAAAYVECDLELSDLRDVATAVQRCRRLLDLDADPEAVSEHLAGDPLLGPLALACPGRRSPGCVDGDELAIRAVLGQQVSVAAARQLGARLAIAYGKPLPAPSGTLTHCFPDAATLAGADPAGLPMPRARAEALGGLAAALASGELALDPGADRDQATERLLGLPGIGPWTAGYIRMRALSDPDAFLPSDAGVLRALDRLTGEGSHLPAGVGKEGFPPPIPAGPGEGRRGSRNLGPRADRAARRAESWRPWRSYAVHHLWATLEPAASQGAPAPAREGRDEKEQ